MIEELKKIDKNDILKSGIKPKLEIKSKLTFIDKIKIIFGYGK